MWVSMNAGYITQYNMVQDLGKLIKLSDMPMTGVDINEVNFRIHKHSLDINIIKYEISFICRDGKYNESNL